MIFQVTFAERKPKPSAGYQKITMLVEDEDWEVDNLKEALQRMVHDDIEVSIKPAQLQVNLSSLDNVHPPVGGVVKLSDRESLIPKD